MTLQRALLDIERCGFDLEVLGRGFGQTGHLELDGVAVAAVRDGEVRELSHAPIQRDGLGAVQHGSGVGLVGFEDGGHLPRRAFGGHRVLYDFTLQGRKSR